jgi:hypothetical protein
MATYKSRDGQWEIEVSEMDEVQAVDLDETPPPVLDYIILTVKSSESESFHMDLEFEPTVAIALGEDIAKQGKSAKND